jgi:hypothetical protein
MLFLTKKKLDARIAEAVRAVIVPPDRGPEIEALQAEIAQLRADAAERVAEAEDDFVRRLTEERNLQAAGVQGLLQAVESVRRSIPTVPGPDPRLVAHAREMRELADTLQYILDGPDPVTTVINNYLTNPGHVEPAGWARQMGAR